MRALLLACGLVVVTIGSAFAQGIQSDYSRGATNTTVTVASAVAGTEIVPSIRAAVRVGVPTGAAVPVCFAYVDGNIPCATGLTNPANAEPCIPAGSGYIFLLDEERWTGRLCAILQSAGSVNVGVNAW